MFLTKPKTVMAALLIALWCGPALGAPRERDVWHAYVADDQRYGYAHTTVTRLEDGNFRYVVEGRLLIDILGASKEEITWSHEYVVTSTYRPVSISKKGGQGSGVSNATGAVRDGKLLVKSLRAARERTVKVDLPDGALFEPCLDDWLNDRPKGFKTGEALVIDEDLWDVQRAKIERLESKEAEPAWKVEIGADGQSIFTYDSDGVLRAMKRQTPFQHLKRCTPKEAETLSYRKLAGRELLDFPIDKNLGRVDRLTELTIKLTWQDIPFQRFQLEDERQQVVEHSEKDGRFQAVVRIRQPKPVADSVRLPVKETSLAPFLAETRFIKPADEQIAATARGIVKENANALEAARALSAWVAKSVKPTIFAETLTGPEILECKQGKCSEYAILFASLARSAGIPTRIVLGQRIANGRWIGHMWNEVYVGCWVTVDAGTNEIGESFALLKLTHADTVAGTQPLRWELTKSLNVSIADFEAKGSLLADKFKTGIEKGVYTNVDFACRISVPADDWSLEDRSKSGQALVRFMAPTKDQMSIHFAPFSLPVPLKIVTGARPAIYKDYKMVKDEEYEVDGLKGRLLEFRRSVDGKDLVLTEILWANGTAGYILKMTADAPAYEKHVASLRKIASSFKQLTPKKFNAQAKTMEGAKKHDKKRKEPDVPDQPRQPPPAPKIMHKKLQQTSPGVEVANAAVKVEIRALGLLMAASGFSIEGDGRVKLTDCALARFGKGTDPAKPWRATTMRSEYMLFEMDRPIRTTADFASCRILSAELAGGVRVKFDKLDIERARPKP